MSVIECLIYNLVFSVSNTLAWPKEINIANLPLEVKAKYLKDNYKFLSNTSIVSNGEGVINLLQTESKNCCWQTRYHRNKSLR